MFILTSWEKEPEKENVGKQKFIAGLGDPKTNMSIRSKDATKRSVQPSQNSRRKVVTIGEEEYSWMNVEIRGNAQKDLKVLDQV